MMGVGLARMARGGVVGVGLARVAREAARCASGGGEGCMWV
jgi:hypothetical protein